MSMLNLTVHLEPKSGVEICKHETMWLRLCADRNNPLRDSLAIFFPPNTPPGHIQHVARAFEAAFAAAALHEESANG